MRGEYLNFYGKPEVKTTLGRPRCRRSKILNWILKKNDGDVKWIYLAHYRERWWAFAKAVMNLRFPSDAGNFSTSWGAVGFWRTLVYKFYLFIWLAISLTIWLAISLTIANPDRSSEVVAVAFNFALLMCNLRHDKPSGVMAVSSSILEPSPLCGQSKSNEGATW